MRDYLRAVRAHWLLVVSLLLVGLAGASVLSWLTTPLYASSTQMFVSTPGSADLSAAYQGDLFSQQRVNTYAELLWGEEISNRVVDDLDLDLTPEELSNRISVAVIPETVLLHGSSHMRQIISELRESSDYVIIDSSPLLPVTDGAVLAALCDGVVLVTRHGVTKREQLRQSAQTLQSVDGRLLGVVLNMVPVKSGGSYGYGYGYGYEPDKRRRHKEATGGDRSSRTDRGKLVRYDTPPVPVARSGRQPARSLVSLAEMRWTDVAAVRSRSAQPVSGTPDRLSTVGPCRARLQ